MLGVNKDRSHRQKIIRSEAFGRVSRKHQLN